jgi:predicted membrane chloride channel (bestrophin family)
MADQEPSKRKSQSGVGRTLRRSASRGVLPGRPGSPARRKSRSAETLLVPRAVVEAVQAKYQERLGSAHFFTQFRDVILRCAGSVLPKIVIELLLSLGIGSFAYLHPVINPGSPLRKLYYGDSDGGDAFEEGSGGAGGSTSAAPARLFGSYDGHLLFGFLLGFLIVFRTQAGYNLHLEGHELVGRLLRCTRCICIEVLGTVPVEGVGEEEARLLLNVNRRLKLFYYTVVEHLRSEVSHDAWLEAHAMVTRFSSDAEVDELMLEFGEPTPLRKMQPVPDDFDATDGDRLLSDEAEQSKALSEQSVLQSRGTKAHRTNADVRARHHRRNCSVAMMDPKAATSLARQISAKPRARKDADFQKKDPTASKPLWVALQLRRDVQRLAAQGLINPQQVAALGNTQLPGLVETYCLMNKVDKMVLPLPYSQLLKLFSLFYVFSVPFVLAPDVGFLTPFITVFLAMGYFGLDQLGAELECPFGKTPNDIPMLTIGSDLCRNLDTLTRLVMRELAERRKFRA